MTWHLPENLATAYVAGDVRGARAASLEAHLMACDRCRSAVTAAVAPERLALIWSEVEEQVDAPRRRWVERLLVRAGLAEADARLVAAAPSLHASWFGGLVAALAFAVLASQAGERGAVPFLIVAPLIPVLAVAGAYGPWVDPTYEVSMATPYPSMRLLLLRSATVVLVSGLMALLASTLVPDIGVAGAWLLPSLALVSLTLALSRWLSLPAAGCSVALVYTLPLLTALFADVGVISVIDSAALQWTALAIGVVAVMFITTDPRLRDIRRRTR